MTRMNVVLTFALVASSLYLVRTAYDSRRLFTELDRAKNESAKLDVEYKRLEAERQAAATNARVERTGLHAIHRTGHPFHRLRDHACPARGSQRSQHHHHAQHSHQRRQHAPFHPGERPLEKADVALREIPWPSPSEVM